MTKIILIIFFLLIPILESCDGGLAPPPESDKAFLNGTIRFVNGKDNWPVKDSVIAIRAAAFKKMPDQDIILSILNGDAYFTGESLPLFVDSVNFNFEIKDAPIELVYIVAVQQYSADILSQRVIGVYTLSGNKNQASSIMIENGKEYNITIDVDFNDLPPMPF